MEDCKQQIADIRNELKDHHRRITDTENSMERMSKSQQSIEHSFEYTCKTLTDTKDQVLGELVLIKKSNADLYQKYHAAALKENKEEGIKQGRIQIFKMFAWVVPIVAVLFAGLQNIWNHFK